MLFPFHTSEACAPGGHGTVRPSLRRFVCMALVGLGLALHAGTLWSGTPSSFDAVDLPLADVLKRPENVPADLEMARSAPRRVRFIRIQGLPDKGKQTLWSSWGDGCFASNQKYYTSIGDHLGVDATSLVYEYSPVEGKLRLAADVFAKLKLQPGTYGHGKIHSGMHETDGWLYFSTYWGKHREVEAAFEEGYPGSLLLRMNIDSHRLDNLGALSPKQGLPTSLHDPARSMLYFYSVYENNLVAYDIDRRQRVFLGGKGEVAGNRAMLLDAAGHVYTSGADGRMMRYDRESNRLQRTNLDLSKLLPDERGKSEVLRAGLPAPLPDGHMIGITAGGRIFEVKPERDEIVDLGDNFPGEGKYTAAVKASPDGQYLYYAPGAHGGGAKLGAPIIRFDVQKRKPKAIVFLGPTLQKMGYQIGGSYNLVLSPDGRRLFATFNGAPLNPPASSDSPDGKKSQPQKQLLFGEPCVLQIDLQ